jgi:3-phenylpropionate/trans-cinnamate dioxygenase ferredoxin subunit
MTTHEIATLDSLAEGAGKCFSVDGLRVAVFKVDGSIHAIDDRCSHAEASLAEGELFGTDVECPRHGAEFDIVTGQPRSLPATSPVSVYPTEVRDGSVFVTLPSPEIVREDHHA